jgi:two-component system, NtrC family, sensor kinase
MAEDDKAQLIERLTDLGHLAGGVGHHVINAFCAIVSNAEILRLGQNGPGGVDPTAIADIIVKEAIEASGVARRLIDYSRSVTAIGGGLVSLDRLMALLVEAEQRAAPRQVHWSAALEPVPPILGHELQLLAMLRHLTANAYESLPAAGGTVTVSTALDERGWVKVEVKDTGKGMRPEVLERAVEPFFTTKPGHFGVGLSIANGIWRRHRGTLALHTAPGKGTTVRLCVEPAAIGPANVP